jgi:two-component system sensor histidine kinase PhoQ
MLRNERQQQTRYRNALDDLAHSFKTPLAVLTSENERADIPQDFRLLQREQLGRMRQIVDYQLKRAAAAGGRRLGTPVAVRPVLEKLTAALGKVYAGKSIGYQVELPQACSMRMDEGDLLEVLGNLLDNASKWCRGIVRVSSAEDGQWHWLVIEDDGPGFPDDGASLLQRGARADTRMEGQGIGLAVVSEIMGAYEGTVRILRSPLGGGRVMLGLPVR